MQARRGLMAAFIVVSALAVLDFVRPASGTLSGLFDQTFVRFEMSQEWTMPPDYQESRTLQAVAIAQGEDVLVDETVGQLRVVETDSHEATGSYTIRVWGAGDAASFAQSVSASFMRQDAKVVLAVDAPDELPRGVRAYQVDLELAVPKGAGISVNHRGNLTVDGLSGDLKLQHFGGKAEVRNVKGEVAASSRYGSIEVSGAQGPVSVSHVGGEAIVRDATGPVFGEMRFGVITVERAAGFVELDVNMGAATVDELRGGADLRVRLGDLTVRLAPEGGWNVQAVVDMGDLETDLPLRSTELGTRTEVSGVVGDGRDRLAINVTQGAAKLVQAR